MAAAPEPRTAAPASAESIDVASLLRAALGLHQAGRLEEAERIYRRILAEEPRHFDSLHLLGVISSQRGDHAAAVRQIDAAIAVNPAVAAAHNNRGVALKALGRSDDALASFDQAVALAPDYFDALQNRAVTLLDFERFEDAVLAYDRATALRPDVADLFLKRGHALTMLKLLIPAIDSYDGAIARAANDRDAHFNRAIALAKLGRFNEAVAGYDKVIAFNPNDAQAFSNRGAALKALRRFDEALASYDRAIALDPGMVVAHSNRGTALKELNRLDEALASFDGAIRLMPTFAEAFSNRANVLAALGRFDEAIAGYDRAVALNPDDPTARCNRGIVKMHVCDWADFDTLCAELIADASDGRPTTYPFQILACASKPAAQLKCARAFVSKKCPAYAEPLWQGERYRHRRIRVAYLSADLRDHPVAYLIAGMFTRHDRSRFETVGVSLGGNKPSAMRDRLMASFDHFIDADTMSDHKVAELIRELEIDIAIDLNGHTDGSRPHVFARKPAPVQASYLGYAGTLGQDYCDYIIADRFVIPEDSHVDYAEQVVYLPDCFMVQDAGRAISEWRPSRADAGLPETGFVFCGFNNPFKITPDVFDVWMRLLRQVEGSVLWLSGSNPLARQNLRREAEARSVAGERLVFAPRVDLNADHLARLGLADLFLDTLYYNAHTSAADALWAGVPVLTCPGATFASRVAGSLLGAVGQPELITGSLSEYEALALQLACDPQRLGALRQKLARNRNTFPLFDTDRFTRHMEAAYMTMWERTERGERPQRFAVSPIALPRS